MRFFVFAISFLTLLGCVPNEPYVINSPSKNLQVYFQIDHNNSLIYYVSREGKQVVGESHLGLEFESANFTQGITLGEISRVKKIKAKNNRKDFIGKINEDAHQKTIQLLTRKNDILNVVIRVSDHAVAISYEAQNYGKLVKETTSFKFSPNGQAWLKTSDDGKNESIAILPVMSESAEGKGWAFPSVVKVGENWIGIDEVVRAPWPSAFLTSDGLSGEFSVLVSNPDKVSGRKEMISSWRLITVGGEDLLRRIMTAEPKN